MNVKTPYKGSRLRDEYCNLLRENEENFRFLSVFCDWLDNLGIAFLEEMEN